MGLANLTDETVARLQKIAVPLEDTFDTVIQRLLDHWDKTGYIHNVKGSTGQPTRVLDDGTLLFDESDLPDVSFTTPFLMSVQGATLEKEQTYWNNLMIVLIQLAGMKDHSTNEIGSSLKVNHKIGKFEINGYKYIKEAGISVQGQDANSAMNQVKQLVDRFKFQVTVLFRWQQNEKAAFPAQRGRISFGTAK